MSEKIWGWIQVLSELWKLHLQGLSYWKGNNKTILQFLLVSLAMLLQVHNFFIGSKHSNLITWVGKCVNAKLQFMLTVCFIHTQVCWGTYSMLPAVHFINVIRAHFLYKRLFSSYVLALAKNSYKKSAQKNVDEIDTWMFNFSETYLLQTNYSSFFRSGKFWNMIWCQWFLVEQITLSFCPKNLTLMLWNFLLQSH